MHDELGLSVDIRLHVIELTAGSVYPRQGA
jgi:hypothetical protein